MLRIPLADHGSPANEAFFEVSIDEGYVYLLLQEPDRRDSWSITADEAQCLAVALNHYARVVTS